MCTYKRGGLMKKFYKENRVFVILMGIALVCIAIILALLAGYVVKSSTNDKYGNRLNGIEDVRVDEGKIGEMESKILEMPKVSDVKIDVRGKIIYYNIDFQNEATIEEVKNAAINCLEFFSEDYLNFYALQFLITKSNLEESDAKFPMIGYRSAGAATISWSNNANK